MIAEILIIIKMFIDSDYERNQNKMKTSLTVFLIILFSSLSAMAQNNSESSAKFEDKLAVKVEYFGELALHPGISAGLEYTILKNNWLTIHWNNDLGGYYHRWNNAAVFAKSSIGTRYNVRAVFADINAGIGYMHSFAAGTFYQRAPDGGVEKARNWGHPHFMPNASFLLGWDATRKGNQKWTVHIGPEVCLQSSFNHIFLPHVAAKLGMTYKFN